MKWQYRTVRASQIAALTDETLNELGAVGWELVCVIESETQWFYTFKRMAESENIPFDASVKPGDPDLRPPPSQDIGGGGR